MSQVHPFHVSPGDGQFLNVMGSLVTCKVLGSQSGGTLFLVEIEAKAAGVGVPMHTHTREDETFYVLEGQIEFQTQGKTILAGPGETVYGPRGYSHQWFAKSPCRMLVIMTPSGMETMFEKLAALPQEAPDMGQVLAICAEAGISFP